MKKNLIKKLALSAATMGVAAISVTTTTYAWFTANSKATASNVTATTTNTDGNLLISLDKSTWRTSVDFSTYSATAHLTPVQRSTTGFRTLTGESDISENLTTQYVWQQTVYFRISDFDIASGKKLNIKLKLSDDFATTAATNAQTLLASDGVNAAGATVNPKLEEALNLQIKQGDSSAVTGVTYTSATHRFLAEDTTNGDALTYYNNLLTPSTNLSRPLTNYDFATTNLCTITAGSPSDTRTMNEVVIASVASSQTRTDVVFGVTFTFFLDGWDAQCYNALAGTTISAGGLNFETEIVNAE